MPVTDVFMVRITGGIVPIGPRSFHSYGLFNDTRLFQFYIVEYKVISELARMWKDLFIVRFQALYQQLSEVTEENHETLSEQLVYLVNCVTE